VKIFLHCCGFIRSILPDLIDAGVDILNPVQFTAKDMELQGLKRISEKTLLSGVAALIPNRPFNKETPQQVSDEVKHIINLMAPGGGFVFVPVHNVQEDVPPENFWAMWDALDEYR